MRMFSILAVLGVLLSGCGEGGGKAPHVGEAPAAFRLDSLTGGTVDFPSQLAGKVVIVRFWASWCAFCKEEMKFVDTIWSESRGKGLEVLAINAGQDRAEIAAYIGKLGVGYPVLIDPGSKVTRLYGVTALPVTLVVGRDGTVKSRILGETDEATLRRTVEGLL